MIVATTAMVWKILLIKPITATEAQMNAIVATLLIVATRTSTTMEVQMDESLLMATSAEVQMKAKVIVAAQLLFVKLNLPHFQTSIPRLKIQSLTKTTCLSFEAISAAQMKAMVATTTTTTVAMPMVLQIKGRPKQQKQPMSLMWERLEDKYSKQKNALL